MDHQTQLSLVRQSVLSFHERVGRPPSFNELSEEIAGNDSRAVDDADGILLSVCLRRDVYFTHTSARQGLPDMIGGDVIEANRHNRTLERGAADAETYDGLIKRHYRATKECAALLHRGVEQDAPEFVEARMRQLAVLDDLVTDHLTEPEAEWVFAWHKWLRQPNTAKLLNVLKPEYRQRMEQALFRRTWALVEWQLTRLDNTTKQERYAELNDVFARAWDTTIYLIVSEQRGTA